MASIRPLCPLALALALFSAPSSLAAPPAVPGLLSYQGVLLDDLGAPRTGPIDFAVRVYDDPLSGTLLYTQSFSGVPLTEGVFSVFLGPVGQATDSPVDPLTTSLQDALAGDLPATAPIRFLELTVGSDPALPRTQILASPYALRATQADVADSATSADTVVSLGGLPPDVVTQIYENTNLDGQDPPNTDPIEGMIDTDMDGIQNFVDPDNDGDGILDGTELAQGTDPNLVTPSISFFVPSTGLADLPFDVTVNGNSFEPGMTAQFGTESPVPQNVTPTSFEASLLGQPAGSIQVTVTLPNGSTSTPKSYTLSVLTPAISGFDPAQSTANSPVTVQIQGSNFFPGLTVSFGSENPTPFNVTDTSFDVNLAGQPGGSVPVVVTLPNSESASSSYTFVPFIVHTVTVLTTTQLSLGTSGSDVVVGGLDEYGVNLDADEILEDVPFPSLSPAQIGVPDAQIAVAFDPTGTLMGVRCVETSPTTCDVVLFRDGDADRLLETGEEVATLESISAPNGVRLWGPALRFDSLNRTVLGYHVRSPGPQTRLARDLDGDGDFDAAGEFLDLGASSPGPSASNVALDASDRVAFAHRDRVGIQNVVRVRYDRNGDGDFDDVVGGNPETQEISTPSAAVCVGVTFDGSGRLAVVYGNGNLIPTLLWDRNGDGDFGDAGETQSIGSNDTSACDVATRATGELAVAVGGGGTLRYLVDLDDDGSFGGAGEDEVVATGFSAALVDLEFDGTGTPRFATSGGAVYDSP